MSSHSCLALADIRSKCVSESMNPVSRFKTVKLDFVGVVLTINKSEILHQASVKKRKITSLLVFVA